MGAERLLGEGDLLFLPPGTSHLQRLHGAYVSDEEIQRITDFVREQGTHAYRMDLLVDEEADSDDGRDGDSGDEPLDEMYDAAVRVVTESGKASISYVQRRLQVGYNRAARMVEQMEREGVVSTADHRGVREVLARDLED
jgi:S-DNA-T family DNA segregation ATPase FtsK/SpoIIIE